MVVAQQDSVIKDLQLVIDGKFFGQKHIVMITADTKMEGTVNATLRRNCLDI